MLTPPPNQKRVLLVDLSERERHELGEQLRAAGFEVMIAFNHADVCLRLLTCAPDGIIADADLGGTDVNELANVIRTFVPTPVATIFICGSPPLQEVLATVLLKPVAFSDLLSTLRASLADREDAQTGGGWTTPNDDDD